MVSYADFMTLLFAFFVVLYSSSQVDRSKMAKLSSAISAGFEQLGMGSSGGAIIVVPETSPAAVTRPGSNSEGTEVIRRKIESGLSVELQNKLVALRETPEGLVLSLREIGFFDSGSATLRASSMQIFDRLGTILASIKSNVRVEGHTDNVPIHTPLFQSNWELSTARATEVIRILLMREGIGPERLSAAGYAEYHPIADNTSEDGRRSNRRVDIVIVAPHALPLQPANVSVPAAPVSAGARSATP